jgi:hypothetical protein
MLLLTLLKVSLALSFAISLPLLAASPAILPPLTAASPAILPPRLSISLAFLDVAELYADLIFSFALVAVSLTLFASISNLEPSSLAIVL